MGSSTSSGAISETNTNVSNTIADNTAIINQAITDISSTSIQNAYTSNTTDEVMACNADNVFSLNNCINMTGVNIGTQQKMYLKCVQSAISSMNDSQSAKNNFYSDITTKFANAVSNNSKLAAAVAMNNSLSKVSKSSGLNGLLAGVTGAMSHAMDDLTGATVNSTDVTKSQDKVTQLITNSVSNTNSTQNVVKNINSQSTTINNQFSCDMVTDATNVTDITNCANWLNDIVDNTQTSSITSAQSCAAKYITTQVLTNSDVVKALTDMVNSATDINSSSVSVQSNSDLSDFNKVSGSFLSDLGLSGLFSGTFGHILFWVILIIIIIIIIVIIYKVYEANKSSPSSSSSSSVLPEAEMIAAGNRVLSSSGPEYNLGTTNSNNSNQLM